MTHFCYDSSDDLSSNRGNHLLMTLLSYRYPSLSPTRTISSLATWLSSPGLRPPQDEELAAGILHSFIEEHGAGFPCLVGAELGEEQKEQMLIFLVTKPYLKLQLIVFIPGQQAHERG